VLAGGTTHPITALFCSTVSRSGIKIVFLAVIVLQSCSLVIRLPKTNKADRWKLSCIERYFGAV
jgi:hypothetical protein